MSHKIEFICWEKIEKFIDKQTAIDIIDLFFDGPDSHFRLVGHLDDKTARGMYQKMIDGRHNIALSYHNITKDYNLGRCMGGNRKPKSLKDGFLSVFRHEVQHANQSFKHKPSSGSHSFYRGKYKGRACEVDARASADKDEHILSIISGESNFSSSKKSQDLNEKNVLIKSIVSSLKEKNIIYHTDIRNCLLEFEMNSPSNFVSVKNALLNLNKKVERND